jgi:hypothetical protein
VKRNALQLARNLICILLKRSSKRKGWRFLLVGRFVAEVLGAVEFLDSRIWMSVLFRFVSRFI